MLMYGRNQHNIVKQLQCFTFNKKKKKNDYQEVRKRSESEQLYE